MSTSIMGCLYQIQELRLWLNVPIRGHAGRPLLLDQSEMSALREPGPVGDGGRAKARTPLEESASLPANSLES
jgi:hypothetical protein